MLIMLTGLGEETHQGHLRRKVGDLSDAAVKRRNPLNPFKILSKYMIYSICFGEKYDDAERFSPFCIST